MDLPQLLHHHGQNPSRYVSVSNPSRPHCPDDPNFQNPRPSENHHRYQNHQFHHQQQHHVLPQSRPQTPPFQPPAPQPAQQQQSPFKAPVVHGYNSGQSEFAYANPSRDRARSSFGRRDFSPSEKFSQHRFVADDDRPRNRLPEFDLESRPEFWEKPRVSADNLRARQNQPLSPFKTSNRLRHESESSSRFRVECGDFFESKHRDELLRGREPDNYRSDLVSSTGKSFHDLEFVSVQSLSMRSLESGSEGYSGRYNKELFRNSRTDGAFDNRRRFDDRVHREGHNSLSERGGAEIGNGNGDGTHFVSGNREYYGPESGKYIRGSREDSHEFNRTPRKQFQKKSALLRIQKPGYRNTENGQYHYYGYHDNSISNSRRRRDQYVHTDSRMDEEEEEGSPVELDVSFKSNSLVAKAIVTLANTSDDIDADLTPRSKKVSDGSVSDRDCSNAESTQLTGNPVSLDSTLCTANAVSTFDKERVESDEKLSSDVKETCGSGSLDCSTLSVANQSLEKNELERTPEGASLEKAVTASCIDKPPIKAVKKKKVVKKIVKKVVRPRKNMLNSEVKKKQENSIADKDAASVSRSSSDKVNNLDPRTEIEAAKMTRKEQHNIDVSKCLVSTQKNGNILSTNQASCMQEEANADKGPERTERCLHAVSNSGNDLDNLCNVSMPPMIEHAVDDRQSLPMDDSLSVDKSLEKDALPIALPIAEHKGSALLNSGDTKLYDNLTSVFYPADGTGTTLDTVHGTELSEEESLVREEFSKATSRSSPTSHTTMDVCSPHHDRYKTATDVSNYDENITTSYATEDYIVKLCLEGASRLPENDTLGSSPNTKVSVGGKDMGTSNIRKKRTIRSQLSFPRKTNNDLDGTIVSNAATSVTLNLSSEDPSYEVGVSSLGVLDDLVSNAATDSVNFDVASLQYVKRRKVSASQSAPRTDEKTADASMSCFYSPSTSNDVLAQQHMEAGNDSMNSENGISVLHNNKLSEETFDAAMSFFNDEHQKEDDIVMDAKIQSGGYEKGDACVSEELNIAQDENQCTILSRHMRSDGHLSKNDFLNFSSDLSSPDDRSGATSTDEAMEVVPDSLTNRGSPQALLSVSDSQTTDLTSVSQISNKMCMHNKKSDRKFLDESGVYTSAQKSFSQISKTGVVSDCTTVSDQTIEGNTSLPLQDLRSKSQGLNITNVKYNGMKNQHGDTISRTLPGHSSFRPPVSKRAPTAMNAKPRTWHRNAGSSTSSLSETKPFPRTVPSQRQLPARDGKLQSTSYVRKGNSLVRNPSPAIAVSKGSGFSPVYRFNSGSFDESKKSSESENRVGVGNLPGPLRVGERKTSGCNKPRTSTTQSAKKLPSGTAVTAKDFTPSPSPVPLSNSDPVSSSENNDTPKLVEGSPTSEAFEIQNGQHNNTDKQTELNEGNLASVNMKRIVYVKRKSNQLVATSNTIDLPVAKSDKTQTSSFDGYYKKRKNQLIRTSLESHTGQPVFMSDTNFNSGVLMTNNAISSMILSRRRSQKVFAKAFKRSGNSLVWTLRSTQSAKNECGLSNHQKVFPHLFPWKRTTYWRNAMHNWNLVSRISSSVAVRKLLLSRKRDTIYTRSINGFSLRKSKVLSVGGSSLKWSKSIERHSKKANEEATLAVAAVERKKREQKDPTCTSSESKDRNHSSRERIFRIGSFRYKMDPSRRTLQRLSDDESLCAPSSHPDKGAKKSYIPKRLVIGYNEYIRIGNGNQLIRDPKKRTRLLASEKVRWSLHTARLRLARKRKYCQFFTRFGRCNKDSGRCPYLHDPSKIAVCTKFLNGSCSNNNCKLTHKVIPERMPDCSYFLQGLCSNRDCPYRHVHVNPKASTCEGFLRGYCADGDECRKKHSYVCPTFEATGTCPQGSKCKLHHPKNRSHGKKRKRSRELKNARGRYFGSPDISALDSRTVVSQKFCAQNSNDIFLKGIHADYIAIDVSDDDTGENNYLSSTPLTFCESDTSSDVEELDNFDELMKPIRLLNTALAT